MTVYKRNKKWAYRFWFVTGEGIKKSKSKSGFHSKKEALVAENEAKYSFRRMNNPEESDISFYEYYIRYLDAFKLGRLDPTTESKYLTIKKYIYQSFGDTPISKITKFQYQKMIDNYAKNHVKISVAAFNSRMKKVVEEAIDDGLIHSNFTRNVIISGLKSKNSEVKYLNEVEAKLLIDECEKNLSLDSISDYLIIFALQTGCRFGEIEGITWRDIDFKENTININKAYDYKIKESFKNTKTVSSGRVISMPSDLAKILKKLKIEQQKLFLSQGYNDKFNLTFRNKNHEIISNNAANKSLRLKLKKINAKNIINFHGLRHTHASILISHGMDVVYISNRLGHKNITITLNVYSHLLKESKERYDEEALDILSKVLN